MRLNADGTVTRLAFMKVSGRVQHANPSISDSVRLELGRDNLQIVPKYQQYNYKNVKRRLLVSYSECGYNQIFYLFPILLANVLLTSHAQNS